MMQMIDPTDRSMPPAMITIASPQANNEISEMCRTLLRRLSAPRKLGLISAVMIARAISTPSMVNSFLNAFMFPSSGGQLEDVGVGQLFAPELPGDRPAAQHQGAMTERRDLVRLRARHDDALALRRELAHDVVHVALRFDVEAARRLVQQQHRGRHRHPLRQHDLLLVA